MRCYDAIVREMEEKAGGVNQTAKVKYLLEKLQEALKELDELAELKTQLRDDLKFHNESVVISISRNGKPGLPGVNHTLMITTAPGRATLEFSGSQFQTLAEVCRLHKLFGDQAREGLIDYSEVSMSERDVGTEVTLHT